MRFHITNSPLGILLSYHLRQSLSPNHSVSLIYKTRALAQQSVAAGNVVRMEHANMIMSARGVRSEAYGLPTDSPRRPKIDYDPYMPPLPHEDEPTPIDSLIITTRPARTFSTLQHLIPRLSVKSTIVLMHEGLGVYENLVTNLFPNPEARPHFIIANSRHEVWRKDRSHVVHSAVGSINFSIVPDPKGRDFEATMQSPSLPHQDRSLVLRDLADPAHDPQLPQYATLYNTVAALNGLNTLNVNWLPMEQGEIVFRRDLVVRSAIDAVAVWLNCTNGQLLESLEARKLVYKICEEAACVFDAQWYREIVQSGAFPKGSSLPRLPTGLRKKALTKACLHFAESTPHNVAVMLRDLRLGRRTQLRYGLGYLLDLSNAYHVPVPTIRTICAMIRARESVIDPADS